ncbi:MAG: hypothetical protein FD127_2267 [Acidimicrobiaceae bacterium]|nr:MAG: hypothetical protein FD127_2267 [Acidimicrobiaceae bacterium]
MVRDVPRRRPRVRLGAGARPVERDQIVGIAGSYAIEATMPGGTTVPMSGITWVSVSATHRRRGVLTDLIGACHSDTDERGEPVAMLFASEGGIYERFGYGIGSSMRNVTIDRRRASLRPELGPARGAVRFVDGDEALAHVTAIWERARRLRAGEVSRMTGPAARRITGWSSSNWLRSHRRRISICGTRCSA